MCLGGAQRQELKTSEIPFSILQSNRWGLEIKMKGPSSENAASAVIDWEREGDLAASASARPISEARRNRMDHQMELIFQMQNQIN